MTDSRQARRADELVEQAWLCFRLLQGVNDEAAMEAIRKIGRTYIASAIAAGAAPDRLPFFGAL